MHNYAERKANTQAIDMCWQQGASLNLAVCGYLTQRSAMIEFQHVGYLEMYGRMKCDSFLSNSIGFNKNVHNVSKIDAPLVQQLSLFDGCQFGTHEVLWKYYWSVVNANQHDCLHQQKRAAASEREMMLEMMWEMTTDGDVEHNYHQDYPLSLAWLELIDDSMDQFCSIIDDAYKTSFEREYSEFVVVGGYLLERKCIMEMYGSMFCLFPFVHSVVALNALLTHPHREQVGLS